MFRNCAPAVFVALNAFIGGARQPEPIGLNDEQIIQLTLDEPKSIMQFSGKPVYLNIIRWQRSIPQYEIVCQQKMDTFNQFQASNQSILLAGNYRGGIAIGDCIKNVYEIAEDVSSQILSTR